MKTLPCTLALLLLAGAAAAAALPAEPAAGGVETAGFHLKNRSVFSSPESVRPPFWPIGWSKQAPGEPIAVAVPTVASKLEVDQYAVTSILLGRPSLAVINGKAYGEGEFVRPSRGKGGPAAPTARVQVQRITDGAVVLATAGQIITVPMKRTELNSRRSEDELVPVNER